VPITVVRVDVPATKATGHTAPKFLGPHTEQLNLHGDKTMGKGKFLIIYHVQIL